MKFKHIAFTAALGVSAVAPAFAVDIDIYGRAHLSVDALGDGEDTGLNVSSNSSRIGFRASKELDANFEVFMQLEQNVRYDQRGGDFATRDSFVGLRGNWGMVRVGSFDTSGKLVRAKVDIFNDRLGDLRNIASGNDMNFDQRFRNTIHYRSPAINNITFNIEYSPHNETGATSTNERQAFSTSLGFDDGTLHLVSAYETYEIEGYRPAALRLAAGYWFTDRFFLASMYQRATDLPGGDRDVYGIGSEYRFGDYSLRGQVYQSSDNDTPDTGATMYAVGVDRRFGSALTLYAIYGVTSNDPLADFSVSAGGRDTGLTPLLGHNATGFSLGMMFNF